MRKHLLLTLATVLAASSASAQDTALDARIRRVENGLLPAVVVAGQTGQGASLTERMRALNTPAVSIAVINDGRIEWARAYGSLSADGGAPADTSSLFQAASISKPVSTVATMLLVQRGELSLDADVNTYLRSWRVPENAFTAREKVTLRRIMSHSAGLTVSGFPGYADGAAIPTTVQIVDGQAPANNAPVRVDTLPGSLLRYSGGGMTVMQLMLEDVTGRPFPALLRETVLQPLGMTHSSFYDVLPGSADRIARAHDRRGVPVPGGWNRYPEMAAAGLWTTPSDLARFILAVHRASRGEAAGPITPEIARQMLTQQSGENGNGFGLGLALDRAGTPGMNFGHTGSNRGYRAQVILFPETGRGAVVMTNSDAGADVAVEVMRSLAREYGWPRYQPVEKNAAAADPAILAAVSGRYQATNDGNTLTLEFAVRDGQLVGTVSTWPAPRTLYPLSATEPRFFIRELDREFTFERNATGRVVRLRVTGGGGPELVAQRVN
jgi:CubicO group peptidase (beta-lactamase class C family)